MWLKELAAVYGERIKKWKKSHQDVAKMAGIDIDSAQILCAYVRKGHIPNPLPSDPRQPVKETDVDGSGFLSDQNYTYNKENDTYVVFIPSLPKPLVIPGTVHRDIMRAYSNFDGQPASLNEISRNVQLPRAWVVQYLRVFKMTHDKEPFTDEEILEKDDDVLVEEALQMRRAGIYRKMEKAKWADIQADAMKWRSLHEHVLRVLVAATSDIETTSVPQLDLAPAKNPYAAVVGLTDFHWGKYSDPKENFEPFDRQIAEHRLFTATEDVFRQVALLGRPEKLYVPLGSDFLHIDTDRGTTTQGTMQDMDGTPAEILESAFHLLESWINSLRQIAPVELVLMSGNHDRMAGVSLLMMMYALFKNAPDVTVHLDRTPRVYKAYGENLIGFIHGDGVKKTQDMAGLMAREAAEFWSGCPHKTIYTGHFHHEKTDTDTSYGVVRRQIPSLAGTDRWHALNGYVGAPKNLPVYIHDAKKGLVAIFYGMP